MVQNGNGWRKAIVLGKEGEMTFAGTRREIPGQKSGLGGELRQTGPVVSRGYKHVQMTSERK